MMFIQPQVHIDTVIRSLRILVLLVSNKQLRTKFIQGTCIYMYSYTRYVICHNTVEPL